MVETGATETVMVAVPLLSSLVPVIVAEPGAIAVTTPAEETTAILVALDVHTTDRPLSTFPLPSLTIADIWSDCLTGTVAVAGVMEIVATGTLDTVTLAVAD
jgi:hypothetical protein